MEFIKIVKNKKFIAAVILLLLFNCVSFYIAQQKNIKNSGTNIVAYSKAFSENADIFSSPDAEKIIKENNDKFQVLKGFADAEKMKSKNAEEYEFYAEEEALLMQENPELYQEFKDGKYSVEGITAVLNFYLHFSYQNEYQNDYQNYIESVIENGKKMSSKKLFADKNSYSYKSIQKATEDFSKNKNLDLELVNDISITSVLNYQTGDFFLVLLCVFLAVTFVSEKNINILVSSCKNGRRILKIKQLPILALFSFFCSAVIYASEMIISLGIYSVPLNLFAPIQSAHMFSDCTLQINFLQLLALQVVFKAICSIMITMVLWLLISSINSIIASIGIAGIIAATELLLYKNISVQSNLSFFKTFNIFSLFDCKTLTEYNLISVFKIPVRSDIVVWTIVLLITIATVCVVVISANHNYPIKTPKKVFGSLHKLFKKMSDFYAKLQNVIYASRFETFKIMHVGKGLLVIIVFLLIIGFNFNTNPIVFSSTEVFLNDYYEKYGGELDDETYKSIEKMQTELKTIETEFNHKSNQYSNGEISFEKYELARAKNEAYDTQRKAVDKLTLQIDRIEQLSNKGIKPVMINESGYNNLFYSQSNQKEILILICATVIMFSSVFSIEKASNMLTLNHCSKNGRKRLYLKKMLTVIPKTFVLTLISYLSLIIQNNYLYKLGNLNANIQNLQCLQDVKLNMSILEYMVLSFVFEFVFVTVTALIITSLSAFASQLITIIISTCIFILPNALYMINIYSTKEISAIFQFNFNAVILEKGVGINSFIIHLALIVFCIVMLILSQIKWCTTKDR